MSCLLYLAPSLAIFLFHNLCRRCFTKHSEDEFEIRHVISEIIGFFGESLVFSILTWSHPEGSTRYLGCEYTILSFLSSSHIPFIGEIFADCYAPCTLINPFLRVSFCFISLCHSLHSELRIFYFLYSLISHLSEPSLEWFSLWGGNRLNDAKKSLGIGTIGEISLTIRCY